MIVYFTGTGNSRRAAQLLAARLEDTLADSVSAIRDKQPLALASEKPWVFVSPTYGWQLPRVFAQLIRDSSFSGSRDAYFVMTCGSGVGGAEKHLRALCAQKGLTFRGLLPLVMPENYVAMFPVPDDRAASVIRKKADRRLEQAVPAMLAGESLPAVKGGPAGKVLSGPVNAVFYRFFIRDKAFFTTSACTGCGKCSRACPVGNITLTDGRPVWNGRCIHCMACICGCPAEAVEYGKQSREKPRYQCPQWEETK